MSLIFSFVFFEDKYSLHLLDRVYAAYLLAYKYGRIYSQDELLTYVWLLTKFLCSMQSSYGFIHYYDRRFASMAILTLNGRHL